MSTFEEKKKKAEAHAQKIKEKQELEVIRNKNNKEKKKIPTHKLVTIYLYVVLTAILIYSMTAMWHFADLSYLGVLITDIAAQIITFVIYSHHSTAQNSEGGISYMALQEKLRNHVECIMPDTSDVNDDAVG